MANTLKIVQWSCQGIRSKGRELELRSSKQDILLLSETWLNQDSRFFFKDFDVVKCGRSSRRGGGSAILVRNKIKYKIINITYNASNKIEACAISILLTGQPLTIVSLYKPPCNAISTAEWESFFHQFQGDFLVGGDFNSHHIRWDVATCVGGRKLVKALDNLNIHCLNDANSFSRASAIDLTLSNSGKILTAHWEVLQESWGSDHLPIVIEIAGSAEHQLRFNAFSRIYSDSTDWSAVEMSLLMRIPQLNEMMADANLGMQVRYSSFMSIIEDSVRLHTPIRGNQNNHNNSSYRKAAPWWNSDCDRAARIRKAAFSKFKYISSQENYLNYNQADDEARTQFRGSKKQYFMDFCDSLNRTSNLKFVWQKVRAMGNNFHRKETANVYSDEDAARINTQIVDLSPPWCATSPPSIDISEPLVGLCAPFRIEELNKVLDCTKIKSCPGPDGLDYKILRILLPEYKIVLL